MYKNNIISVLLSTCLLAGCASANTVNSEGPGETKPAVQNTEERQVGAVIQSKEDIQATIDSVDAYQDDITPFVESYSDFAMSLSKKCLSKGDNYVISPLSVYCALVLLSNAAAGQTLDELESVLGLTNEELNRMIYTFARKCEYQDFSGSGDMISNLKLADSVWLNDDYGFKINDNYKEVIQSYFDSDVFNEKFSDLNSVIDQLNAWTDGHTDGLIQDMFSQENVSKDNTFLLVNALAYKNRWQMEFRAADNTGESFKNYDGNSVTREMMHSVEDGFWEDEKASAVKKPLLNTGDYVMFILPKEGVDVYDYFNSLDGTSFRKISEETIFKDNLNEAENTIDVHLSNLTTPKFDYSSTVQLDQALQSMGVHEAYKPSANLSKMLSEDYNELYLSTVFQQAKITMNEEGISGAAVTVAGGLGAAGPEPIFIYHDFKLDRPFIYSVMTREGVPVFVGIISDLENEDVETTATAAEKPDETKIGTVTVNVDRLNVRSSSSTSGEKLRKMNSGDQADVYEIKENEDYTWYRIGKDEWIADNGEWLTYQAE